MKTLMIFTILTCLALMACDQVDLYFFKVGEKKESCGKSMTIGKNTGDTLAVKDSANMCGTGEPEVTPK